MCLVCLDLYIDVMDNENLISIQLKKCCSPCLVILRVVVSILLRVSCVCTIYVFLSYNMVLNFIKMNVFAPIVLCVT